MEVLHGLRVIVTGAFPQTFTNWYSLDKAEADKKSDFARKIAPPQNCVAEFVPVESAVLVTVPGDYKTENGKTVRLSIVGNLQAHGHYLNAKGRVLINRPCTFYINGLSATKGSNLKGAHTNA